MTYKRKGMLLVSGEWRQHLRKFWRRRFWKKHRQAERGRLSEKRMGRTA